MIKQLKYSSRMDNGNYTLKSSWCWVGRSWVWEGRAESSWDWKCGLSRSLRWEDGAESSNKNLNIWNSQSKSSEKLEWWKRLPSWRSATAFLTAGNLKPRIFLINFQITKQSPKNTKYVNKNIRIYKMNCIAIDHISLVHSQGFTYLKGKTCLLLSINCSVHSINHNWKSASPRSYTLCWPRLPPPTLTPM